MTTAAHNSDTRWIVAQEGSRETYAVPLAFHRLHLLRLFCVDIWCRFGRSLLRCGPEGARALATRFHPEIPRELVKSFGPMAIFARARDHMRQAREVGEVYIRFGQWFAEQVRHHLEKLELHSSKDIFFGFNTNCLETLEMLKARGIFTVVDQVDPGKTEEDLVLEEAERWPGWTQTRRRLPQGYWDRLSAEWQLADVILVNSEWSAIALRRQGVPPDKLAIAPLAIDLTSNHAFEPINPRGTLKVLWLGSIILRKGIPYLVEAARRLQRKNIEFLLAGPVGISEGVVRTFPSNITLLGRITRNELGRVYKQAHVFVLPTLSDGFAITQLEAMAHGLPVIATPNCGKVVTHGADGFIVPVRDSVALAEAIVRLETDRGLLQTMSRNALQKAAQYDLPSNARMIQSEVSRRQLAFRREGHPARALDVAGLQ